LDTGVSDVISGEPSGIRLALELCRVIAKEVCKADAAMQILINHREWTKYAQDLDDCIHVTVWDYFRVRLQTGLPAIDQQIEPGQPRIISEDLIVGPTIDKGSFGMVCKLVRLSPSGSQCSTNEVVKIVDKRDMTSFKGIINLKNQIQVMQSLSSNALQHPNITKLYQMYHTGTHVLFRMENAGPLDLFKRLVQRDSGEKGKALETSKITTMLRESMLALCHLHLVAGVAHRDIKPENIIVSETADNITIKLTDFDTAIFVSSESRCWGTIGTFPFMAPEMALQSTYLPLPADVWSLGIVFLEVVCRTRVLVEVMGLLRPKNSAKHKAAASLKIQQFLQQPNRVEVLAAKELRPELTDILDDVEQLLKGMLIVEPDRRCTAGRMEQAILSLL